MAWQAKRTPWFKRSSTRWAAVAVVLASIVVLEAEVVADFFRQVFAQSTGYSATQNVRMLHSADSESPSGPCAGLTQPDHTVDCVKMRSSKETHRLSSCNKCWHPLGPDLVFSWSSDHQKSFREVSLDPSVFCHGIQDYTRTCFFRDILWDLEKETWVMFGEFAAMKDVAEQGKPWIRLDRTFTRRYKKVNEGLLEEGERHMHVEWRPASQMPSQGSVITSPLEAVHLRVLLNPASIGHFLRDNLLMLVAVPMTFGLDPRDFVWLQAESDMIYAEAFRAASPLLDHYRSWMPKTDDQAHMLWTSFIRQARQGAQKENAKREGSTVRYVRFPKLLAGRGGADHAGVVGELEDVPTYQEVIAWSHVCKAHAWQAMRNIAYTNNALVHKIAKEQEPLILFIDGKDKELRNFPAVREMLPELRKKLPEATIQYERISELTGEEQIEVLSRATVLVTTVGSRSFRLAFLPDGAQVVLVGPPEYWGEDKRHLQPFFMPFREVEWCWGSLGYINILPYHISETQDLEGGTFALGDYLKTRDSYTAVLRMEKLLPLLKQALHNVQVFGGGNWN